jgi:hypothetical protein
MEFDSKGGVDQKQMDALGDMLATEIRALGPYRVIGKNDIRTLLRVEEQKTLLGCNDLSCMAEIGGALGVRWVVVGNISRFGEIHLLNLKLLDVAEVQVVNSLARKIPGGQEALIDALSETCSELFASVRSQILGQPGDAATQPMPAAAIEATPSTPMHPLSTWGHAAFWSGLGATAFGGVAMGLSMSAASDYKNGQMGAWDTSRTWTGLMWTGFSLGAALMATGVALWVLAPDSADASEAGAGVSAVPTADGQGFVIGLGGRW